MIRRLTSAAATPRDWYDVAAYTVRDHVVERWVETANSYTEQDPKRVYYLSLEFLIGRMLGNAALNLGIHTELSDGLSALGHAMEATAEKVLNTNRSRFGSINVFHSDGVLKNHVSVVTKELVAGKRAPIQTLVAIPTSVPTGCNLNLRVKVPSASTDSTTESGTSMVKAVLNAPHSISMVFFSVTARPFAVRVILLPSTLT